MRFVGVGYPKILPAENLKREGGIGHLIRALLRRIDWNRIAIKADALRLHSVWLGGWRYRNYVAADGRWIISDGSEMIWWISAGGLEGIASG